MTSPSDTVPESIGTRKENSLHAALKTWYSRPGDLLEAPVDDFIVDILRGDTIIEIQTRNFGALRAKFAQLLERYPVRLIHPVAHEKWIVRLAADGHTRLGRRKSPKRGSALEVFRELVYLPELLLHANFSLEIVLTQEEEVRCQDGRGSWRRQGWSILDRRLLQVVDCVELKDVGACRRLLPSSLSQPFTSSDLAEALGERRALAQKMLYCLRKMHVVHTAGKRGRYRLYTVIQHKGV